MIAGREMDALIARELFGFATWRAEKPEYVAGRDWIDAGDYFYYPDGTSAQAHRLPDYSTDISAAWLVVERLISLGYPTITISFSKGHQGYIATVWRSETDPKYEAGRYLASVMDEHLSAPLAICLAALKAIEEEAQGNA